MWGWSGHSLEACCSMMEGLSHPALWFNGVMNTEVRSIRNFQDLERG